MEILNNLICQYDFPECDKKALGMFRGKWTCGRCLLKIEAKINQRNKKVLDIIEEELRDNR